MSNVAWMYNELKDELALLRISLENRVQDLTRELAGARLRILALERAIASNAPSAAQIADQPDNAEASAEASDCPDCVKRGGLCYNCEQYLDGLAFAGDGG